MKPLTKAWNTQFIHPLSNRHIRLSVAAAMVEIEPKQKISPAADPQMGDSHPAISSATALTKPCGGLPYTIQMRSFEPSHPFDHSCVGGGAIPKSIKISPNADPQMGKFTPSYHYGI